MRPPLPAVVRTILLVLLCATPRAAGAQAPGGVSGPDFKGPGGYPIIAESQFGGGDHYAVGSRVTTLYGPKNQVFERILVSPIVSSSFDPDVNAGASGTVKPPYWYLARLTSDSDPNSDPNGTYESARVGSGNGGDPTALSPNLWFTLPADKFPPGSRCALLELVRLLRPVPNDPSTQTGDLVLLRIGETVTLGYDTRAATPQFKLPGVSRQGLENGSTQWVLKGSGAYSQNLFPPTWRDSLYADGNGTLSTQATDKSSVSTVDLHYLSSFNVGRSSVPTAVIAPDGRIQFATSQNSHSVTGTGTFGVGWTILPLQTNDPHFFLQSNGQPPLLTLSPIGYQRRFRNILGDQEQHAATDVYEASAQYTQQFYLTNHPYDPNVWALKFQLSGWWLPDERAINGSPRHLENLYEIVLTSKPASLFGIPLQVAFDYANGSDAGNSFARSSTFTINLIAGGRTFKVTSFNHAQDQAQVRAMLTLRNNAVPILTARGLGDLLPQGDNYKTQSDLYSALLQSWRGAVSNQAVAAGPHRPPDTLREQLQQIAATPGLDAQRGRLQALLSRPGVTPQAAPNAAPQSADQQAQLANIQTAASTLQNIGLTYLAAVADENNHKQQAQQQARLQGQDIVFR